MDIYQADHLPHNVQWKMVQSDGHTPDGVPIDLDFVLFGPVHFCCQVPVGLYISSDTICVPEPCSVLQRKPQKHLRERCKKME